MQYDIDLAPINRTEEPDKELVQRLAGLQDKNLQLETQAAVLSK